MQWPMVILIVITYNISCSNTYSRLCTVLVLNPIQCYSANTSNSRLCTVQVLNPCNATVLIADFVLCRC